MDVCPLINEERTKFELSVHGGNDQRAGPVGERVIDIGPHIDQRLRRVELPELRGKEQSRKRRAGLSALDQPHLTRESAGCIGRRLVTRTHSHIRTTGNQGNDGIRIVLGRRKSTCAFVGP